MGSAWLRWKTFMLLNIKQWTVFPAVPGRPHPLPITKLGSSASSSFSSSSLLSSSSSSLLPCSWDWPGSTNTNRMNGWGVPTWLPCQAFHNKTVSGAQQMCIRPGWSAQMGNISPFVFLVKDLTTKQSQILREHESGFTNSAKWWGAQNIKLSLGEIFPYLQHYQVHH